MDHVVYYVICTKGAVIESEGTMQKCGIPFFIFKYLNAPQQIQ